MRAILLAAVASVSATFPVSLAAQDNEKSAPMAEMAERMADADEQDRMAAMLAAMSDVFLEMPVGPMFAAMERAGGVDAPDVDEGATLRDVAGEGADRIPEELSEKVPMMMGMLANMAENFGTMQPMLEDMAERMREQTEAARDR